MTRSAWVWFAVQFALFVAMLAAPIVQRTDVPVGVRLVGAGIAAAGLAVSVAGYAELGRSHSPGTTPGAEAHFVQSGIYTRLRHPIYAGWCLVAIGFAVLFGSLLGVGIASALVLFYDLRTREEEKFLLRRYAGYDAYRRRVKRFVPGVY